MGDGVSLPPTGSNTEAISISQRQMNPPPAATSTGRCVNCSQWGDTTDTSLIPMWYLGLGCQDWISDKVDYEGSPTDLFIVVQWFR